MKIIRVGRSTANDIVIQNDPTVSGNHCQFIMDDYGNSRILDLNSTNGTYINGVRRQGETQLQPGDIVRIGNTTLPWQNYFGSRAQGTSPNQGPTYVQPQQNYQPYEQKSPVNVYVAPPTPEPHKGSGFGIASFILGLLGISLLAIIFGIVSISRREPARGLGIAGLILGILWTIAAIIIIIIVANVY